MGRQWFTAGVALAFAAAMGPAHADIYTWVDKDGITNVSNLQPPDDVRVKNVARAAPKDPAREAALRDAARLAEMRALHDRVDELAKEVDQARNPPFPPPYAAAPVMAFAPPPPAPTVVVTVINQPAPPEPAPAACDNAFGCGLGFFPAYTYYAPAFQRGWSKPHRRWTPARGGLGAGQIVPPLIPYPSPHPMGGRLG